jgi:hypothetical protein
VIRLLPSPTPAKPFEAADALDRLVIRALATLKTILAVPLPKEFLSRGHKGYGRALELAKVQLAAAECVLRVQTRVDRNRLRGKEIDRLPELLRIIEEEKRLIAEARTIDASPHKPR